MSKFCFKGHQQESIFIRVVWSELLVMNKQMMVVQIISVDKSDSLLSLKRVLQKKQPEISLVRIFDINKKAYWKHNEKH